MRFTHSPYWHTSVTPALMGDSLISSVGCCCPEGFEFVCFTVADEKPVDFM